MKHFSQEDTQELPRPKFKPRHKKENNIGAKFLVVLTGVVAILGVFAYVDWASLGGQKANGPSGTVTVPGPTATETRWSTETARGKDTTRTVTSEALPGPTVTATLFPSAVSTVTVNRTVTVTATVPVPGPTKTIRETVTATVTATVTVTAPPVP